MLESLQSLHAALRTEAKILKDEKTELDQQRTYANASRRVMANKCLADLLPDLKMPSIDQLRKEVPSFAIPVVSKWLGLSRKVDPKASLDQLRIRLGTHLDIAVPRSLLPDTWTWNVVPLDDMIQGLQIRIRTNAERLADVNERIAAVEKLLHTDLRTMDPVIRDKVQRAVESFSTSKGKSGIFRRIERNPATAPAYPVDQQLHSDSGPDLLQMWLWYQLMTQNSTVYHEIARMESGPVIVSPSECPVGVQSDPVSDGAPVCAPAGTEWSADMVPVPSENQPPAPESIEFHYELGAANFS